MFLDSAVSAGNSGAYFIFEAGCIDNLQRCYVNAASRTRTTTRRSFAVAKNRRTRRRRRARRVKERERQREGS